MANLPMDAVLADSANVPTTATSDEDTTCQG